MAELRYVQAVNQALMDSMQADESVVVFGEDIALAGGSFKATRGLLDAFGSSRVRDTPISEASIVSAAVGAAMSGLKPVVEIMFMDFMAIAMDGLVNQAAKARFMFGGRSSVPMVLRTPHGGGLNAGPQHSQCLEAWVAHVPGLKVVCPSNAQDAYSLLRAAIQDPDPVVFVEHKGMYGRKGSVDIEQLAEIGKASIVRSGTDVTLVTYGATVHLALEAAQQLEGENIRVEVLDLRSLQPWDHAAVFESVARTHRVVIAHEAVQAFGAGAEIAAWISEEAFDELDAPVVRVGAPFMPVPFATSLEKQYAVNTDRLIAAIRKTLA
ncbi:alpha-ketoacid dehydrogenase subunit beta [Pollutimonas nitritireducens]|uniref:Alpha-ketoacid dehydrogenase subunit beta n=1 Tax=Pollutimonas nitritireducens TaxID=2045209 RepID=A0A2N4UB92_9BURK|nr:alpha-ketoacid dehydrogenase subunit beta [Pollutimonas nitritireducens]PLC52268.1 alpha-ketoacid dehydrogenase subunit beta [Pollutimonas nitritireducens]